MSLDPNLLLNRLRDAVGHCHPDATAPLSVDELAHVLRLLDHQLDQVKALQELIAKKAALPAVKPEESICAEADRIVSTDRQSSYGHPFYNFTQTARLWEVILDRDAGAITPTQIGLCMIALKLARYLHKPKRDSLVDLCGYAKTVQMCEDFDVNDQP